MKRNKKSKIGIIVVLVLLLVSAAYIYTAPEFEREMPLIESEDHIAWNRTEPLSVKVTDNRSLKKYQLILSDGKKSVMIQEDYFENNVQEKTLLAKYPENKKLDAKAEKLTLTIIVKDNSMWNFFQGNENRKTIDISVDYKRPNITILANSYSITQGGSALVVFFAEDKNLDELYVSVENHKFKAQPYRKKGYYAALIAWPFNQDEFQAKIIATDKANNKREILIPYYVKYHNYRVSWIKAKDKFIDGKIADLAAGDLDYAHISDRLEKFVSVNEKMRLKNEILIHNLSKNVSDEMLKSWPIKKFYPLKGGQRVASYGDERHYYLKTKNNEISHSNHVGYDLASTKMAPIKTSNKGKVVYASENGIYGTMPMIDHGLGLYSLYGHCSQLLVSKGDEVSANQVIAKTGQTGLALGDHLHFGLVIQGIEVRPVEWFDKSWIRKNIDNIFQDANRIISEK